MTRFPPDERAGHGHHTASALLAQEAFNLTNDGNSFPETAKQFGTWQVKRLYTNTGRWWNQTINENTPGVVTVDMGGYNAMLGKSYSEVSATSRTMHKSQGFGSQGRRGEAFEFFEYAVGEKANKDLFDGINTSWTRVKGGETIQPLVETAIADFNEEKPYSIISQLITIRKAIVKLDDGIWKQRKLDEVDKLIRDCLGLYLDATSNSYYATPNTDVKLSFEVINRSPITITLSSVSSTLLSMDSICSRELAFNKPVSFKSKRVLSTVAKYSGPYWLKEEHEQGLFTVSDPNFIGRPQAPDAITFTFVFDILGEKISYSDALDFKSTDPVKGELTRPVEITPPVFVNIEKPVFVFATATPKIVDVSIKSTSGKLTKGEVKLKLPDGWKSEPPKISFELLKQFDEQKVSFTVTPGPNEQETFMEAVAIIEGKEYNLSVQEIIYDHISVQTLLPVSQGQSFTH